MKLQRKSRIKSYDSNTSHLFETTIASSTPRVHSGRIDAKSKRRHKLPKTQVDVCRLEQYVWRTRGSLHGRLAPRHKNAILLSTRGKDVLELDVSIGKRAIDANGAQKIGQLQKRIVHEKLGGGLQK